MATNFPADVRAALARYAQDETGKRTNAANLAWVCGLTQREARDAVGELLPVLLATLAKYGLSLLDGTDGLQYGMSRVQGNLAVALSDHTPYLLAPALHDYWACEVTPAGSLHFTYQVQDIASRPEVAGYLERYWLNFEGEYRSKPRARVLAKLAATYSSATLRGFRCLQCGGELLSGKVRMRAEALAYAQQACQCCRIRRREEDVVCEVALTAQDLPAFLRKAA